MLNNKEFKYCYSFDEMGNVFLGHDYGGAVWMQAVKVKDAEKITDREVKEIGKEISVYIHFFDWVLKPIFLEVFDPEMPVNKKRYTYAFSDEGRYINCFEENILEYNFFTYDQIGEIITRIENLAKDITQRAEKKIGNDDAKQMLTLTAFLKEIMDENPETNLISVLS